MNIQNQIVNWLGNYLNSSGMTGFVVGISGGIDSAVVSTLAAQTGQPVYAVTLPIRQNANQLALAQQHQQWLAERYHNVKILSLDLTQTFAEFDGQIFGQLGPAYINDLAMANSRSRLRMMALYAIAQSQNCLVVGTGNKIEDFGVGFFTKWGDGGVDLSPIADLYKSEVYTLGRELGIVEAILQAPPTDGLWDDSRSDQDQLGTSYADLEWAMQNLDMVPQTTREKAAMNIYRKFNKQNQHKMLPIPVCKIQRP